MSPAERPGLLDPERNPVVVVGAGTMGSGIALQFARLGYRVSLVARRQESVEAARVRIEALGQGLGAQESLRRLAYGTDLEAAVSGARIVYEMVPEDAEVKRQVYALIEAAAPDCVLLTNTSSLTLGELSRGLSRPERFAGLHWMNPPHLMPLVEVVRGPATAAGLLDDLADLVRRAGKVPVLVDRDVAGFLVNRLQYALAREAYQLVQDGVASAEDVDRVVTYALAVRWSAVGPLLAMDLAGLDVVQTVCARLFPSLASGNLPPPLLDELVSEGSLGLKCGQGLYELEGSAGAEVLERRDAALGAQLQRMASFPPATARSRQRRTPRPV